MTAAVHPSLAGIVSDDQVANLRKLSAYLRTLPADYPDFEMDKFTQDGAGSSWHRAHVPACGTAACAAGHGPAAQIAPIDGETWAAYTKRAFIDDGSQFDVRWAAWNWCFGGDWSETDNTVHGAANRIDWLLANGLPEDADEQCWGEAPLCYREQVQA